MTKTELQLALAEATQTNKKTAGVFLDTLSALAYKTTKKTGGGGGINAGGPLTLLDEKTNTKVVFPSFWPWIRIFVLYGEATQGSVLLSGKVGEAAKNFPVPSNIHTRELTAWRRQRIWKTDFVR
jgi:hypothetical protein